MLSNVPHVARNVWLRGNARYKSNSHRAMSHTLQATCGTLHFIENERSDKTLFGVFGQRVPALCLEVELLAIAGDEAGT